MAVFSLTVYDNEMLDYMEGHEILEHLPDHAYDGVVQAIINAAEERTEYGWTRFEEWFFDTEHFDKLQDLMMYAMDEYIDMTAKEVIKSGNYEMANCNSEED